MRICNLYSITTNQPPCARAARPSRARAEAARLPWLARMNGLLFLLGGGCGGRGAVARVPSLVAPCAPVLTPLCACGAAFLAPFCSPASPLLTALCPRHRRDCGRRRGRGRRGGRRGGLSFRLRPRQD